MTSQRLFNRAIMMVLSALLLGAKLTHHQLPPANTNKSNTEVINKVTDTELQAPLDLSVPFRAPNNKLTFTESTQEPKDGMEELFASKPRKKEPPFQVKGNIISSPEPEIEKRKSFDGAGIIFNIKE